ncbi:hypothetical protein [Leptospira vanthielii]|nr:hypothetical protein [Leptospira vanthielii]
MAKFFENFDTLGDWVTFIGMKKNNSKTIIKSITNDVMEAIK